MLHRILRLAFIALGKAAVAMESTAAQSLTETAAATAVSQAYALAARILGYHDWTGLTPPPASYCLTMRQGGARCATRSDAPFTSA
jgi:hypothetical protein